MAGERGERRQIVIRKQDVAAGLFQGMPKSISEKKIRRFCGSGGCDNFGSDGHCQLAPALDASTQARYVATGSCGWASVGGKRGTMTSQGFQPNRAS